VRSQALTDRILATYLLETPLELERAVRALASEGSTGTFVDVPGETAAVRARFGTRLEALEELESSDRVQLIGARGVPTGDSATVRRARVTISVPLELTGTDLATVMACLLGNVFELSEVSGLRLEAVTFPEALLLACPRPRYGVAGTRALLGVHGRPIFGSIVRPALGLRPEETAAAVRELLDAGIDFVKDDELMASPAYSPLHERIEAVMRVVEEHADRTGRRATYAFNITDEPDAMLRHQDAIQAAGGTCAQVNLVHVGIAALAHLRRHGDLVIHGHRTGWAMQTRSAGLGMGYRAYAALWRLAGADHLIVTGLRNKYWESDASALEAIEACLDPLLSEHDRALPVVAAGQWGGQIPDTFARTGTSDWLYLAGAGVTDHPGGPAAGVRALEQAWEAARGGEPLEAWADENAPELAASIRAFGTPRTAAT
jgi:ribulose 1,5-bisphosphate carboxylase large subunit-like protein